MKIPYTALCIALTVMAMKSLASGMTMFSIVPPLAVPGRNNNDVVNVDSIWVYCWRGRDPMPYVQQLETIKKIIGSSMPHQRRAYIWHLNDAVDKMPLEYAVLAQKIKSNLSIWYENL